eukprot:jgi/Mesen1/8849/ME000053S08249
MAPILLVNLHRERATTGLHLAVTSFDGYLYVIDGQTACAEAVDVGETSYSMVLADNIDGGDDLDLIVSTMNGNVYCFQTPAPYHPLKAWQSQAQGRNVLSPRYGREGVYVLPASRQYVDVGSDFFVVQFEIVDARVPATKPGALASAPPVSLRGPYEVKLWLMIHGRRDLQLHKTYEQPGVHTVKIPCPLVRAHATVLVEMHDEHQHYFSDEFALTFHLHFFRLLKWVLALPVLAMVVALVVRRVEEGGPELPSFSASQRRLSP